MSIQDMIKKSVLEAENFSNAIGIEMFLNIVILWRRFLFQIH